MTNLEHPKVTVAKYRLSSTEPHQNPTVWAKIKGVLFQMVTCGGLFWPQRWAKAKMAQEEATATLMNAEAEARLLEAKSRHNESIAKIERAISENEKTKAEAEAINLNNELLRKTYRLDRTDEEIAVAIENIITQIRLAGGTVEFDLQALQTISNFIGVEAFLRQTTQVEGSAKMISVGGLEATGAIPIDSDSVNESSYQEDDDEDYEPDFEYGSPS